MGLDRLLTLNNQLALDINIQCTPAQFEQQWKLLLPSKSIQINKINKIPALEECCDYFAAKRIMCVASGGTHALTYRIFIIAQKDMIRFLGELTVDIEKQQLKVKIKSNEISMIPQFVQCLQLQELFGIDL
jgi:hypothetical protein